MPQKFTINIRVSIKVKYSSSGWNLLMLLSSSVLTSSEFVKNRRYVGLTSQYKWVSFKSNATIIRGMSKNNRLICVIRVYIIHIKRVEVNTGIYQNEVHQ